MSPAENIMKRRMQCKKKESYMRQKWENIPTCAYLDMHKSSNKHSLCTKSFSMLASYPDKFNLIS